MARRKSSKHVVNFANAGKAFPANAEVLVKCTECSLEEGTKAPYFSMKLEGVDEYAGAIMFNNASLAEGALFRTVAVYEAFGVDIPEGDFSPTQKDADEFVGQFAMCSTFKDRYEGKVSIKPEDFWPAEGHENGNDDSEGEDFDLDELEDDDIKALGKQLKIRSKSVKTIKSKIEDMDDDDVLEALEACGLLESDDEEGSDDDGDQEDTIDIEELSNEDIKALAKAAGVKGRVIKRLKTALGKLDEDELMEAAEEAGLVGDDSDDGDDDAEGVTAAEIKKMSEDELEELIEEHELDVDLDDFKTLRKKAAAVISAAEEAEVLED